MIDCGIKPRVNNPNVLVLATGTALRFSLTGICYPEICEIGRVVPNRCTKEQPLGIAYVNVKLFYRLDALCVIQLTVSKH